MFNSFGSSAAMAIIFATQPETYQPRIDRLPPPPRPGGPIVQCVAPNATWNPDAPKIFPNIVRARLLSAPQPYGQHVKIKVRIIKHLKGYFTPSDVELVFGMACGPGGSLPLTKGTELTLYLTIPHHKGRSIGVVTYFRPVNLWPE